MHLCCADVKKSRLSGCNLTTQCSITSAVGMRSITKIFRRQDADTAAIAATPVDLVRNRTDMPEYGIGCLRLWHFGAIHLRADSPDNIHPDKICDIVHAAIFTKQIRLLPASSCDLGSESAISAPASGSHPGLVSTASRRHPFQEFEQVTVGG